MSLIDENMAGQADLDCLISCRLRIPEASEQLEDTQA